MKLPAGRWRIALLILWAGVLPACSTGYATISDQSIHAVRPLNQRHVRTAPIADPPGSYTVRRGDTLYSIAWRYGMDYRHLASINGISGSYDIYPGEKLRFKGSPVRSNQTTKSRENVAKRNQIRHNAGQGATKSHTRTKAVTQNAISSADKRVTWHWPVKGKIIGRFRSAGLGNKGLDISARTGEPVHSAANGVVVYAGSGLLGYGNLVIINHNQKYLSAYAHNSRILVKENEQVKAGQKIAEIGSTGASRPMLHFEIRRDGKPVDPLKYLPKQ